MERRWTTGCVGLAALISCGVSLAGCGEGLAASSPVGDSTQGIAFTPQSGPIGTLVTISGTDFSSLGSVSLSGVAAIPLDASATSLTAMIMPGSASGSISVETSSGVFFSSDRFTVTGTGVPATAQGGKLVGTGASGNARQGESVALSADGNTALVGGMNDDSNVGAAWVYVRSGGTWSQQGSKLVGTGYSGSPNQGQSVALGADGNTALIGGPNDNSNIGATWVFSRSGGAWSEQTKLVATDSLGLSSQQGWSVALSADSNTALIGGPSDHGGIGATWVYVRSGGTWSEQTKLVGTGNTGASNQGLSVALSADGNTALVGGQNDDSNAGAAWVFHRSGATWSQQGAKISPPSDAIVGTCEGDGEFDFGNNVALSADGNTALIASLCDNSEIGAVWVFVRSGGTWSEQSKLVGTGYTGSSAQGVSVALSADGNTALVGGSLDDSNTGAVWVFTRSGTTWSQRGSKLIGAGYSGTPLQGSSLALSADGNTALSGGWDDDSVIGAAWVFVP